MESSSPRQCDIDPIKDKTTTLTTPVVLKSQLTSFALSEGRYLLKLKFFFLLTLYLPGICQQARLIFGLCVHVQGWWIEEADESEEDLTLPQTIWDIMERLHCAEDKLSVSSCIVYGGQLANTSSSTVYEATLDGLHPVVVKV